MWNVPLFDTSFDQQECDAAVSVIRSGWLSMGEQTEAFEAAFAAFVGARHAIAVSSGTAALHLAHLALGIGPRDEVICPSLSFVAAANTIIATGAQPVFADIQSHDVLTLSPDDVERRITSKTRAIQILHYAGYAADMKALTAVAEKYKLPIIEDCAHAPGSSHGTRMCGTLGALGCFSFFSNKNLTTAEGGMITTHDDSLAERLRLLRSHGMTSLTLDRYRGHAFTYDVLAPGFNYRIDEIRSALGLVQLQKLAAHNLRRAALARYYRQALKDSEHFQVPFSLHRDTVSNHIFPILLNTAIDRAHLMRHMRSHGIQTSIHYPPIHRFDYYQHRFHANPATLPITESVSSRLLTLPLYPSMRYDMAEQVVAALKQYVDSGGSH